MDHQLPGYGWTLKKLGRWVEDKLQRTVSRTTLRMLLKQAGFSWKKCKKVLGKAKPVQRAKFVEQFQGWFAQVCQGQLRLLYIDEVHLHQEMETGYCWSTVEKPTGSPVTALHSRTDSTGTVLMILVADNAYFGIRKLVTVKPRWLFCAIWPNNSPLTRTNKLCSFGMALPGIVKRMPFANKRKPWVLP